MEIKTNCVQYELPKVRVLCDTEINSSIAFFYIWSLFKIPCIAAMYKI